MRIEPIERFSLFPGLQEVRISLMSGSTPIADESAGARSLVTGDVQADLTFIVRQDAKPYFESSALTGGEPKVFFNTEQRTVTIRDMRPLVSDLSLDRQGFVLCHHKTVVEDLHDDDLVDDVYVRELDALLKESSGADRVVVFYHTRRRTTPPAPPLETDREGRQAVCMWTTPSTQALSAPVTLSVSRRSTGFSPPGGGLYRSTFGARLPAPCGARHSRWPTRRASRGRS
jgi:hypothetical protein